MISPLYSADTLGIAANTRTKLPGIDLVVQAETEKKQIQSKELILNAEKKLHENINKKPVAPEEILAKIASGEKPPKILVKISTGSSEEFGTIAQAQKEYCFVCDYEELRGLSNKDIQKKLGFETFNDIDLYATFIIPPKNVKVERVTFDMLKNDVKKLLGRNDCFGPVTIPLGQKSEETGWEYVRPLIEDLKKYC